MSNLTILRRYAQKTDPASLPSSILFTHTKTSLTIFDAYPKAIFHFLVLPRITAPLTAANSTSLKALAQADKELAKSCIQGLADDARQVRSMIEDEMLNRYGFKWPIWMGFHAVQSMDHLHLHIISSDLCSPALKNKKHYNSFHPKLGFFLHVDDVLSWFEATPSFYKTITKLDKAQYESKLKEPLECFRCEKEMKNIPTLKTHLQMEWDELAKAGNAANKKRQRSDSDSDGPAEVEGQAHKKRDLGSES